MQGSSLYTEKNAASAAGLEMRMPENVRHSARAIIVLLAIAAVLALIGINFQRGRTNARAIANAAELRKNASATELLTSALLQDFVDIETGQRGYLLSGDDAYLRPYHDAQKRMPDHIAQLRAQLSGAPQTEMAALECVEGIAKQMTAEADETIQLRSKGYRHRALLILSSNRAKENMDRARTSIGEMQQAQQAATAHYDHEFEQSVQSASSAGWKGLTQVLLSIGAIFALLWFYVAYLERELARRGEALSMLNHQMEGFTHTVAHDLRSMLSELKSSADSLLTQFGDFLPRRGQEQAEHIKGTADESTRLIEDTLPRSKAQAA
jgi:CHASE3 domain sensor protein